MSKSQKIDQLILELWNDFELEEGESTMGPLGFFITTYPYPNDQKHFKLLTDECKKDMKAMHDWQLPTRIKYVRSLVRGNSQFDIYFYDRNGKIIARYHNDEDGDITKAWPATSTSK